MEHSSRGNNARPRVGTVPTAWFNQSLLPRRELPHLSASRPLLEHSLH